MCGLVEQCYINIFSQVKQKENNDVVVLETSSFIAYSYVLPLGEVYSIGDTYLESKYISSSSRQKQMMSSNWIHLQNLGLVYQNLLLGSGLEFKYAKNNSDRITAECKQKSQNYLRKIYVSVEKANFFCYSYILFKHVVVILGHEMD